jgi:hypothetical protein
LYCKFIINISTQFDDFDYDTFLSRFAPKNLKKVSRGNVIIGNGNTITKGSNNDIYGNLNAISGSSNKIIGN